MDGRAEYRHGPQPYEGIVSTVCEAFHCAPDVAERQDWRLANAVLDYRLARWAVDSFNDLKGGAAVMGRNPHLMEMLRDMVRAQTGADEAGAEEALAAMRRASEETAEAGT